MLTLDTQGFLAVSATTDQPLEETNYSIPAQSNH